MRHKFYGQDRDQDPLKYSNSYILKLYKQEVISKGFTNIVLAQYCRTEMIHQATMLLLIVLCRNMSASLIDLTQTNLYSNSSILHTICNKDMELDFYFSSTTRLTCQNHSCSITNANQSSLFFLDPNRVYLRLKLKYAELTTDDLVKGYNISNSRYFVFYFTDEYSNQVDIIVPFVNLQTNTSFKHLLFIDKIYDTTFRADVLSGLKSFQDPSKGLQLNAFNFLNYRDYCKFAQVANHKKTHTVLISEWVINLPYEFADDTFSTLAAIDNFSPDYAGSGNKICYASYDAATGMFQTHLRENWSLWTCFFVTLFYWAYYLIAPARNNEVFDTRFKENKWTCWGFYSLHHLAYDDFFPRLARVSLLLFSNSCQALILGILYTVVGVKIKLYSDYSIVAWFSVVATVSSIPLQYLMGGLLLRRIYKITHQQLKQKHTFKLNQVHSKDILNSFLLQNYKIQCNLAFLYYWYYLIIFFAFVCFWAATIHMTLWMHLQFYYLHGLWLASFILGFVIDNLVLDPLFAYLLGNFSLLQSRGFYYPFQLGQLYKKNQIDD